MVDIDNNYLVKAHINIENMKVGNDVFSLIERFK